MFLKATAPCETIDDFVTCWKRFYSIKYDHRYNDNINVEIFSTSNLHELYIWKNATNLSQKKQIRFDSISQKLPIINQLKKQFSAETFRGHFGSISAIWQIFLLHVIQPNVSPIFDQHVYRAYQFLNGREIIEMPNDRYKHNAYRTEYVPFFNKLKSETLMYQAKDIDEALWAFGLFLKRYPKLFS